MVKEDIKPRDLITKETIDDAFALDMAMGGSTNTVLHTLAIAHEAEIEYDVREINEVANVFLIYRKLCQLLITQCMMFTMLEELVPL